MLQSRRAVYHRFHVGAFVADLLAAEADLSVAIRWVAAPADPPMRGEPPRCRPASRSGTDGAPGAVPIASATCPPARPTAQSLRFLASEPTREARWSRERSRTASRPRW